jgi:hypothetical protein
LIDVFVSRQDEGDLVLYRGHLWHETQDRLNDRLSFNLDIRASKSRPVRWKDAEKDVAKVAEKDVEKVAEKEAEKEAEKKDAEKDAEKDAGKNADKDEEKDAEKDAEEALTEVEAVDCAYSEWRYEGECNSLCGDADIKMVRSVVTMPKGKGAKECNEATTKVLHCPDFE